MPKAARDRSTLDLFEVPQAPALLEGSLNYAAELCGVLSAALKRSSKSRYEIAARMAELLGQDVSKFQLDAWTAESREGHRFPFEYAAAFEAACETTALQELLARKRGSRILVGDESLLTELGRIEKMKLELAQRERALKDRIKARR
jgi:hypothetical protein